MLIDNRHAKYRMPINCVSKKSNHRNRSTGMYHSLDVQSLTASYGGVAHTAVGAIAWRSSHGNGRLLLCHVSIQPPDGGRHRVAHQQHLEPQSDAVRCRVPNEVREFNDQLCQQLVSWSQGECVDFANIVIDSAGFSEFRRRVTEACREIAWGETTTYGELARRVGCPRAARGVGRVMASNPFPIVVPCHRVVASDGQLRGFSAPGGIATKERLLRIERQGAQRAEAFSGRQQSLRWG
jgi:O-6-methylguanine DNA methyltransferase